MGAGFGYDYLDYLYDLYQLIVQNDYGPVYLVGHSLGGAITSFLLGPIRSCGEIGSHRGHRNVAA